MEPIQEEAAESCRPYTWWWEFRKPRAVAVSKGQKIQGEWEQCCGPDREVQEGRTRLWARYLPDSNMAPLHLEPEQPPRT